MFSVAIALLAASAAILGARSASARNAIQSQRVLGQMPPGWRRGKGTEVGPEAQEAARRILREHHKDPHGTAVPFEADGLQWLALIEAHFHPEGGPTKPWGWHTGVTLLTEKIPGESS